MAKDASSGVLAEQSARQCRTCQASDSLGGRWGRVLSRVRLPDLAATLDWRVGGVLLGLLVTLAIAVQGPIGVSTAYVTVDAAALRATAPSVSEQSEYLSTAAKSSEWLSVGGILAGGLIASVLSRSRTRDPMPSSWRERFGSRRWLRFGVAFVAGALLLFGARLAGGCTSGHVISGLSQLALSGAVFAAAVFGAALPTAWLIYRRSS